MPSEANGIEAFILSSDDVFADEAVGFELVNGTVRITFAVAKMTEPLPPSPVKLAVIGRLIMPVQTAQRLSVGLNDYLAQNGLDPSQALTGGMTPQ